VAASLSTSIGTLTLERPTILASGILGISLNIFERLYRAGAGAVVTKSLSKEPWDGYANPTIFSVKGGGWLNAVGLSNPGAPNFAKMITSNKDVPIIVSLVGSVEDDFDFMVKQFENCKVSAYELNLSCPHVAKVGLEVGDDVELVKKIVKKVKIVNNFYKEVFNKKPNFAILGLNPHNFSLSKKSEEKKIINKAIKSLIKLKIKVTGPVAPDSSFTIFKKYKFDVIIGMYHDQVLTPFKALYNFEAINITLGLPYIRISPDHGVAENIIGKKIANPRSLIESIKFFNYIN